MICCILHCPLNPAAAEMLDQDSAERRADFALTRIPSDYLSIMLGNYHLAVIYLITHRIIKEKFADSSYSAESTCPANNQTYILHDDTVEYGRQQIKGIVKYVGDTR